ncbi:MAG TPA: DNA polymerase III subunit alpha, partial [Candidatus Acidoferrales bacterium]
IQGGMIDDFILRKHGKRRVTFDLPELKEILEETYGVILYQEQVMQIANRLAGFSLGEADILRRAMGKKKREEMASQREKFLTGCRAHKVPEKKAERIFDLMAEFAGYGFNKSHSCAYALLAYQTAYLKTHYPVEFMAALLTSETGNTEKVVKYINEARGMGITVLPPDINSSDMDFTPVESSIRFGLRAIKNVGENTVRGIIEARAGLGRIRSLFQFCESVDPRLLNRRVLESLIKSGAMDSLGARRAQLFAAIDKAMERGQKIHRDRTSGQHGLFAAGPAVHDDLPGALPDVEEWTETELLDNEYATVGFYISSHPLAKHAGRLKEMNATELSGLEGKRNGEDIVVAGIVASQRQMRSKKGDRWAIITLQDMTGMVEVLVFPEAFARLESKFRVNTPLLIKGRVNVEEVGTRVSCSDAKLLDDVVEPPPSVLQVRMAMNEIDEEKLENLDELFEKKPGPCRVAFELVKPDGTTATLEAERKVQPDRELVEAVQRMCGTDAVRVLH